MEEFGLMCLIVICVVAVILLLIFVVDWIAEYSQDSFCRDNEYPDAINIKNQGWYCVGISDGEPYLVKLEDVVNGN